MKAQHNILHISWYDFIIRDSIRQQTKLVDLPLVIADHRRVILGHIVYLRGEAPAYTMLQHAINITKGSHPAASWKHQPGWPLKTWLQQVIADQDSDTAWIGTCTCSHVQWIRPRRRPHCIRRVPSAPRKGHSTTSLFRPMSIVATVAHLSYCWALVFLSGRQCIGAHALCMQHNPTAAALSTSFLLNHAPQQPDLNALTTRFRESYSSISMSRESKRLKKSRSNWLNSINALIQQLSEKMRFSCFPVLPGSAEPHVIWGGIVKCFMIAYFMGNISAKKYRTVFMYVKVIAKQRWDVFETQCRIKFMNELQLNENYNFVIWNWK